MTALGKCNAILSWLLLSILMGCATTTSTLDSENAPKYYVYTADFSTVFARAVDAVGLLSWDLEFTDKQAGIIKVKTPMSLLTWGDKMIIRIVDEDNGNVRVEVSSSTGQAIDWGKNRRNIQKFYTK